MDVQLIPAGTRGATVTDWLDSRHSFSYGSWFDPANTHFGLLLACNEDRLSTGFPPHPHRDIEVVTWVLSGVLEHSDDAGHQGVARPGVVQRMSAGTGVRHSERAVGGPAHYVQMWLRPAVFGQPPAYDTVPVGEFGSVTPLRQPDAVLDAGTFSGVRTLAPAPYVHLLVVAGTVTAAGATLGPGDALRIRDAGATGLDAPAGATVLAWRMRASIG